jgi:hypothetical protein
MVLTFYLLSSHSALAGMGGEGSMCEDGGGNDEHIPLCEGGGTSGGDGGSDVAPGGGRKADYPGPELDRSPETITHSYHK